MTSVASTSSSEGRAEPATKYCPECGTEFKRELVPFEFGGEEFGYFWADVCANGHEYFLQESREQIQKIAKALGFWGERRAGTATSMYIETMNIDLPDGDLFAEESVRPTQTTTVTISLNRPQLRRKLTVPSAAP